MNGAVHTYSPFLDEPWRRLAWIAPLAIALWAAILFCFTLVLEQSPRTMPEPKPVEAQIVELPPVVGGLQGGPAKPAAPPAPAAPPKPRVEVKRRVAPRVHPRKLPAIPEEPPSESGTSKAPVEAAPSSGQASSKSAGTAGGGAPGASSSSGGGKIGSDSLGARAIYSPMPKIPDDLRQDDFQAVAVARFEVSYDGTVKVTLVQPTPSPRLNAILLDTLRQWRFFPAMKGGVAINSIFEVRIPVTVH